MDRGIFQPTTQKYIERIQFFVTLASISMTIEEKNGPVAVAVAVPSTNGQAQIVQPQVSADGIYLVDIPAGVSSIDADVTSTGNAAMVVSSISKDSSVYGKLQVGHYIHGLIMPEIEIINLKDSKQLHELLVANLGVHRQLIVSAHTSYYDRTVGETNPTGPLYKHNLPIGQDMGVSMSGFPPVIVQVLPTSPLSGRLHPGQTVVALIIPGQPTMNLAAGAFTGVKVQERLTATGGMEGRKLVVKDGSKPYREVGNSAAVVCDDCVIL